LRFFFRHLYMFQFYYFILFELGRKSLNFIKFLIFPCKNNTVFKSSRELLFTTFKAKYHILVNFERLEGKL